MKAAPLIGGLPPHNFELADELTLPRPHQLDDFYIPNTMKTKELLNAFRKRELYYEETKEKPFSLEGRVTCFVDFVSENK